MKLPPDVERACLSIADRVDGRTVAANSGYTEQRPPRKVPAGPSEAEFTRQVIELCQLTGWLCVHFRPAMTRGGEWVTAGSGDVRGWPDLVMLRGERIVVAELKVGKNRPTPEQTAWLAAFRAAGVEAHCWRPKDWGEIEAVLRGPAPGPPPGSASG